MQLKPSQVAAHLQRGLAPVYVVAGEEPLLAQEALDAIRAKARASGFSEREVLDADKTFDWQKLVDACASLSLFASRRIVEVRLGAGAPGEEGGKVLAHLARTPAPDLLLIVSAGKLEYRQRTGGWFKTLEDAGASVYALPVNSDELPAWIAARLKSAGVVADAEAVRELAERTEGNLLAAAQDVEKLKLLYAGAKVGAAEVQAAVADSARFDSFDLSDKILRGDTEGSVRSLLRLREEGVELPELVGALAYTLRQWAAAAAHYSRSKNAAAALEAAGVWRTRQEPFAKALPRAKPAEVLSWIQALGRIDRNVKSGAGERGWEELITCAVQASGRPRFALSPQHEP